MIPNGYVVILNAIGQFELRYYPDVNFIHNFTIISSSHSYDAIMRALLIHRTSQGMQREYWL